MSVGDEDLLFEMSDAEREKVRRIQEMIGCNDEAAIESVLKSQREEDRELKAAMKSFGAWPSGRRERDSRGRVVNKPHDPRPAKSAEENGSVPRRDKQGYRIKKPYGKGA